MKIIIGLGNPEAQHTHTRHNAGFLCVDFLRKTWRFPEFQYTEKVSANISRGSYQEETLLLAKPHTYMNDSGASALALLQFYKLTPQDIAVIHDDLDIAPGTLRITHSSRAAGHNGVADIIEKLGTQDFFRLRLGIGRPTTTGGVCIPAHDFVLQKFSSDELSTLQELFPQVQAELSRWLSTPAPRP